MFQRQAADQFPDGRLVLRRRFATEQWGDEYAFAGGIQDLATAFKGARSGQLAADLQIDRQGAELLQAGVLEGLESGLGFPPGEGQFGRQGAGEDLLGRF